MKYKLIKTTINVKTHAVYQTIDICNNDEELTRYQYYAIHIKLFTMTEETALKIAEEEGGECLVEIFKIMFEDGYTPEQALDIWNLLPENN